MRASVIDQIDHSSGQQRRYAIENRAMSRAVPHQPHRAWASDGAGGERGVHRNPALLVDHTLLTWLSGDVQPDGRCREHDATLTSSGGRWRVRTH